ncbi:hypothetical protein NQ318_005769 [Aromia moschata]|uniref:Cytochrome P450 n=1 Tax=Aromia moschata TaxID=1265417 RepID=A0AAV8YRS9_9CUCU|nr:hypothetical protein NQ318_005769 [Aromia moschata]
MCEAPLSTYSLYEVTSLHTLSNRGLLVQICLCAFLIWCLRLLWSRRRLYELASKMPGPFSLPLIGSALSFAGNINDTFSNIMVLFKTYPGLFRVWYGPKLLVAISDPKYFEILLPNYLKKQYMYTFAEPVVGHGLFTAPVDTWKRHRKTIMPTFNQKILDGFVQIFSEQAEIFIDQLKGHSGNGEFDIFNVLSKCTLDIICETAMGVKINSQTTDHPYPEWVDRIFEIVVQRAAVCWYHCDLIFNLTSNARDFKTVSRNLHSVTEKVVREKKKAYNEKIAEIDGHFNENIQEHVSNKKAFLDYLIEVTSEGSSKFTNQELANEVTTFIIAGSDTTASTSSYVFITLGIHQDLQQKVYDEIIEVVGPTRPVEPADLPHLKYTEMFIKETLRLFPVATMILRDIDEEVALGDYVIPGGVTVVFGILWAHTDEKYWPEPYKFDPDRFLPEEVSKRHPCAYVPFSYGSRNCIGMKYAMMAMKAMVATVLRKYRISTSYKSVEDVKLKFNLVTRPMDGYKVSVMLRS